jgi:integrase
VICFVLDTGVRIDEALTARTATVDYDNLLVTVFGKGRKERRIPFSFELRKVLFRWERERALRVGNCRRPAIQRNSIGDRHDCNVQAVSSARYRIPMTSQHGRCCDRAGRWIHWR